MITDFSQLDPNGTYSYADYVTWKFSEFVELVKGHVVKMAAPRTMHQRILTFLVTEVNGYARKRGCHVFVAPFDVRFPAHPTGRTDKDIYTVVQPDLCVICDSDKIDERGCIGAPDWIIEIISPSSFLHDRITKRDLYEAQGVGEYWIVYPHEKVVEVHRLNSGQLDSEGTTAVKYASPLLFSQEEAQHISPRLFPALSLDLLEVFA